MPRDSRQYLNDILGAIDRIRAYTDGLDALSFKVDRLRIDAVNMNLMIIGEATRSLPDEVKQRQPGIDWRNINGLRNIITHEYFRLNLDRIWDVVEVELPPLRTAVLVLLDTLADDGADD